MKRMNMVRPGSLRLEDVPAPAPGEGEALVEVKVVGVCGSDVHAFRGKHPFISCPIVPGHEFSGIVRDVGPIGRGAELGARKATATGIITEIVEADALKAADRQAAAQKATEQREAAQEAADQAADRSAAGSVNASAASAEAARKLIGRPVTGLPSLVCGTCYNCRHGRYNICASLRVIGCQADGALAEFARVPADFLVPLPEGLSFEDGAMIEPVAVGVHAVRRAGAGVGGARVLVLGSGTIGLAVVQVLKAYGAREVIVTDVNERRLELARKLGADHTIDVREVDPVTRIHEQFGRDGVDLSFECVGIGSTVRQAILANRKGTRAIVVGVFEEEVPVPMGLVQDREIELVGSLMYTLDDFSEAARLVGEGLVRVAPLVTHRFRFEEAQRAFETASDPASGAMKVLITI
ncbi:MAG: zinc-binding dehydrogenase [Firmicutes bacterium]|nr:zinc-binding dehydrogenase [Bacillota bacterium]MDH7496386.1 zinc-binding dehydrogenase [Bacillota bacterium]